MELTENCVEIIILFNSGRITNWTSELDTDPQSETALHAPHHTHLKRHSDFTEAVRTSLSLNPERCLLKLKVSSQFQIFK